MLKKAKATATILFLTIFESSADGIITNIGFSGPDDPHHPNIVQINIEGGYKYDNCNKNFAAIRVDKEREHLISFALLAYAKGEKVGVTLNPNNLYYSDRCTISTIYSAK